MSTAGFQLTGVAKFSTQGVERSLQSITNNLSSVVRTEHKDGRQYLVAPATLIVPGVLHGSKGALYYPPEEVRKNVSAWNRMPLTLGHPTDNGGAVSARKPGILERFSLGHVFNAAFKRGKLVAEAWFDMARVSQIAPDIIGRVRGNHPIELSTGLFTDNFPVRNGSHNGRRYQYVARNYKPDHLAILLRERGACSLNDGCGVLINQRSSPFVVTA